MQYIIRELRFFVTRERCMLGLIILCLINSVNMALFYYGFDHHLEQKQLDNETGSKCLKVTFYDPNQPLNMKLKEVKENLIQKGDLIELLINIDEKVFEDCKNIEIVGKYIDDVVEDPSTDMLSLAAVIDFVVKEGRIEVSPEMEKNLCESGRLRDGRYFEQMEYDQKKRVCIAPIINMDAKNLVDIFSLWKDKYAPTERGIYIIDGKEFECIGHYMAVSSIPMIPATVMRDDVFVMEINFEFEHIITRSTYETIANEMKSRYGKRAEINDIRLIQTNFEQFNSKIRMMISIIFTLAIIIISFQYDHIINIRKECFCSYKICGMTNDQISMIILYETMIIVIFSVVIGILGYHMVLLPFLEKIFEYLSNSAQPRVYILIGMHYIVISYFVLKVEIKYKIQNCIRH